jgi:glycosyltransferase involved in cell wall biosynthesis
VKILHYLKEIDLKTGGVVRCVLDLCSGLAAARHEVTLVTTDGRDLPGAWKAGGPGTPRGVVAHPPQRPGELFSRSTLRRLEKDLGQAEVLHLHGMWTASNIQLAAMARRLGLPYVYSVHGMLDDWCMSQRGLKKRLHLMLFGRRMLQAAAAVHTTAQAELDQARRWFPGGKGVVVPLVVDLTPFAELPGPEPARRLIPQLQTSLPILLFLSRLHYKKGPELLIRAADRLRREGRACLVLLAGSGEEAYLRSLHALVARLGLQEHVVLPGFVSGVEKISLLQAADLFILPTSQENFGFALFEALAATAPVITTRGVDTWPELQASGGSLIVDPDPSAIAAAVAALLDDPSRRDRMGHEGRRWVFENLGVERVVHRFERIYVEAITGVPPDADSSACSQSRRDDAVA